MNARSLSSLCQEQLAAAKAASNGRSAVTIFGGREHDLRQTAIALVAGTELHEHEAHDEASLQVLTGDVRLTIGDEAWEGAAGDYVIIPAHRHALAAVTDAVVLLTVATRA